MIDAFNRISDDYSELKLKIFGTGPLKDELQKKIDNMGLSERVFLCGPTNDIPSVLQKARLFILSSDYEGMPNALMEAMAVGVPCISTDCPIGGPRALFGEKLKKYLVKCNDGDAMAETIISMLECSAQTFVSDSTKAIAMSFKADKIYEAWHSYLFD